MDLDIRKAVLNNLNNASFDDVTTTINDAINLGEEKTLPGLGVLFELLWNNASAEWKAECANQLVNYLN
ncbi:MAG: small acid-soluble spore protein SspI [Bacilli bacterium]|nr:small acid-soluble spore protein SspI [Bacilli bacterium]